MTKVTFIGNAPTKENKHIELVKYYASDAKLSEASDYWLFCELAKQNAKDGMDLIICYDLNSRIGIPYLGHWNDGTTSNKETVCTVLGENLAVKKGKGIEFVKILCGDFTCIDVTPEDGYQPKEYGNVCLLSKGYDGGKLDLIYAYNENENGDVFFGSWNDGFVE
jgi:hypothetical protein